MAAVLSLLLIILISILITKVATIALTHTGLSKESARFQARSALTGVGFTTNESENVVNHPIRRKVLMLLMIVGNAGIVTAMASLILTYVQTSDEISIWWKTLAIFGGIAVLWYMAVSRIVNKTLSWIIERLLKRYSTLPVFDFASLLHLAKDYQVSEFFVKNSDWIANRSLRDLDLSAEGLLVLGIERQGKDYIGTPQADTKILSGDKLIIYGRGSTLQDLDERRKGPSGDKSHFQAARVQKHIEESQEELSKKQPDDD